jgi:hypothetical protein
VLPVELLDDPFGTVAFLLVFGFGLLIELAPPTEFVEVAGAVDVAPPLRAAADAMLTVFVCPLPVEQYPSGHAWAVMCPSGSMSVAGFAFA